MSNSIPQNKTNFQIQFFITLEKVLLLIALTLFISNVNAVGLNFESNYYLENFDANGCTNPLGCNYDPDAKVNDGSCLFFGTSCNDQDPDTSEDMINSNCECSGTVTNITIPEPNANLAGCTNPDACNYDADANADNGSCAYIGSACNDSDPNTDGDMLDVNCECIGHLTDIGNIDPEGNMVGCTNSDACNFDPEAKIEDESCIFIGSACDDYNPNTTNDMIDVNCECIGHIADLNDPNANLNKVGCTSPLACNYDPAAKIDDGRCMYFGNSCDDLDSNTIDDMVDSNCECTGIIAVLNNLNANTNKVGCTNPLACNYDADAKVDDGRCMYFGNTCDDFDSGTYDDKVDSNCECTGTEGVAISLKNGNNVNTENSNFYISEVYPNPANNKLIINYYCENDDFINLSIYDHSNRMIKSIKLENGSGNQNVSIDLMEDEFINGMYLSFHANKRHNSKS